MASNAEKISISWRHHVKSGNGLVIPKRKGCHFDEIINTGCNRSCQIYNFQSSHLRNFRHNDDIFVSVIGYNFESFESLVYITLYIHPHLTLGRPKVYANKLSQQASLTRRDLIYYLPNYVAMLLLYDKVGADLMTEALICHYYTRTIGTLNSFYFTVILF